MIDLKFSPEMSNVILNFDTIKVEIDRISENGYKICIDDQDNIIPRKPPVEYDYLDTNLICCESRCENIYWCHGLYYLIGNGNIYNHTIFPLDQINIILNSIENGVNKLKELNKPEVIKIGKITITTTRVPSKPGYVKMEIDGMKRAMDLKCCEYMFNGSRCFYFASCNQLYITTDKMRGIIIPGCVHVQIVADNYIELNEPMTEAAAQDIIEWIRKCVDNYDKLKNTEVIKCGNVTIVKTIIDESFVSLTIEGLPAVNEYICGYNADAVAWTTFDNTIVLYEDNTPITINGKYYHCPKDLKVTPYVAYRIIDIIRKSEEKLAKYKEEHENKFSYSYGDSSDKIKAGEIIHDLVEQVAKSESKTTYGFDIVPLGVHCAIAPICNDYQLTLEMPEELNNKLFNTPILKCEVKYLHLISTIDVTIEFGRWGYGWRLISNDCNGDKLEDIRFDSGIILNKNRIMNMFCYIKAYFEAYMKELDTIKVGDIVKLLDSYCLNRPPMEVVAVDGEYVWIKRDNQDNEHYTYRTRELKKVEE